MTGDIGAHRSRRDGYGVHMRIDLFTFSDVLYKQISQAFEQNGTSCTRFTDELSLIRFLQRNSAALVSVSFGWKAAIARSRSGCRLTV